MRRRILAALICALFGTVQAGEVPEYRVKAAFLYNFAQYTEWPESVPHTLRLCTFGHDPFGSDLDGLANRMVGDRTLQIRRQVNLDQVRECHLVYVSRSAISTLGELREHLRDVPVLVVTDSPGAARDGAMINMAVTENRVTFEANRRATRAAGLDLRSPLLRLATEVIQ